jgi:hypothetical protein
MYQTTSSGLIILEGRVSHPLTRLNVKTSKITAANPTVKTPYRTVGTFNADKLGKFRIEVDQNAFEQTAEYTEVFSDLEMVKVDLRQPTTKSFFDRVLGVVNGFVKSVEAATTTSISFEPIPQYIEGYAYDAAGKAIAKAKVGVYLTFSNAPYSTTTADEKGFFKFTSEYLPSYPYELRYTSATGAVVKVKPSVFIAQNQKYLVAQKIDPFVGRDLKNTVAPTVNPKEVGVNRSSGSSLGTGGMPGSGQAGAQSSIAENKTTPTSYAGYILILVVVLLALTGVGVWLIMHFRKAHGDSTLPPPQGVM